MDRISVTGNTTVVGGPLSHIGDTDYMMNGRDSSPSKKANTGKLTYSSPSSRQFSENPDLLAVDRPYFVVIGKDGLIAALRKLDEQLAKVLEGR